MMVCCILVVLRSPLPCIPLVLTQSQFIFPDHVFVDKTPALNHYPYSLYTTVVECCVKPSILNFYTLSRCYVSSSSDLSLSPSPSSSYSSADSQPAASRLGDLMPKLSPKPRNAMPPNKPKARASPFGSTLVAKVNRPPDTKGPTARPAAESVCANPFSVPRTLWFGAEFVICVVSVLLLSHSVEEDYTNSNALVKPPTAATVLTSSTTHISNHSQPAPCDIAHCPSLSCL